MRATFVAVLIGSVLCGGPGLADDDAPSESAQSLSINGEPLNPRGRYSNTLVRQTPRYYLWQDSEGWHLRTASQQGRLIRFQGSIKVTGGTIGKLREVGLERRGGAADTWTVSEDRTQVEFEIATAGSFDGFDFTISGAQAQIEFDLSMGKRQFPRRIYIGRDGQHPAETKFTLPSLLQIAQFGDPRPTRPVVIAPGFESSAPRWYVCTSRRTAFRPASQPGC